MLTPLAPTTDRVALLREELLRRDLVADWPALRGHLAQEALARTVAQPQAQRIAAVLDSVFHGIRVEIRPHELLVGSRGAVGYPEIDDAVSRGSAEYPYMIADFDTLLEIGAAGVIARAEARLRPLDEANPDEMASVHFLRSVISACTAMISWAERYAEEAERQAAVEADPLRRVELVDIAARCRRVPAQPAQSFTDALQSVWFLYVALYIETPAASCLGRLDQYLFPYYQRDLACGALTREGAKELLCCLWLKLYENVQGFIASHAQTITLGGLLPNGASGVNALSFLCIDVAAAMGNVGAQIAIRWHEAQDPALLTAAFQLAAHQAIMPQLFNDHTYLTALERLGVPFADASQFALFGCHEPVISGMGYQRPASWPGYVSFYDWLQHALGLVAEGIPPQLRVVTAPPATADELWQRWLAAMHDGVRRAVISANYGDKMKCELLPRPLMSAFLKDCIANGADLTAGGARYNMTGFQGCGLATAVDSFLAVAKVVFTEQQFSLDELITALIADYAGYEEIRLRLSTCGTGYGRDCAEADAVAQRLIEAFCDEVESHRNLRGGCFTPGLWSFLQNVEIGRRTAASPEGRHAGQPISHSMDPVSGKAINGPTAVLNSAAGLCQHRLSNGGSLLLEFSTNVLKDPQGCAAAQALCETYLQMGGIELQLSCASVEQLLAAREHPEQYRDLVVRIAGYSDFFVRVSPELQAYIIEREKHVM